MQKEYEYFRKRFFREPKFVGMIYSHFWLTYFVQKLTWIVQFGLYIGLIFTLFIPRMLELGLLARDKWSSGHTLVYSGIIVFALIVFLKESKYGSIDKRDTGIVPRQTLKGFILSISVPMFAVGICEGIFNLAYYTVLVPDNQLRLAIIRAGISTYGNLALLAMAALAPASFAMWYYYTRKWFLISVAAFVGYMGAWILIGFPITINSTIGITPYYPVPWVNAIEIISWYVFLIPICIGYLKCTKIRKQIESVKGIVNPV